MANPIHPLAKNTRGGYNGFDVESALQKAIRRSDEEAALFWASEMHMSDLGAHCWSRLLVMVSEDIGLAEPTLPATIWALREIAKTKGKKDDLQLMHAVLLISRAKKSRLVDSVCGALFLSERKRYEREIPDYALDKHTRRGRTMGRGIKHFLEVGSVLVPKSTIPDPYLEAAAKAWLAGEREKNENKEVAKTLLDITEAK